MNDHLTPRIAGKIEARHISVGHGVIIEEGVHITAERVILGDFCYIGRDVRIIAPEFRLGDYSKLHAGSFGHGDLPLQIGRNCWIGGNTVLDSLGGLDIDDNVGIGAHSQIWTHIQFGDIIEGCRWHNRQYMHIGKDAWFVGHCIVSPVRVEQRAMALAGSVITHDMQYNHVYGGVPAQDLTDKLGPQFAAVTLETKAALLRRMLADFAVDHPEARQMLHVVTAYPECMRTGYTYFNVSDRTYTQSLSALEVAFLRKHTPLIKFTPDGAGAFIKMENVNEQP